MAINETVQFSFDVAYLLRVKPHWRGKQKHPMPIACTMCASLIWCNDSSGVMAQQKQKDY